MGILLPQMNAALRFYTGDSSWWCGNEIEEAFWMDKKGYLTLNSLFFKGIDNEQARAKENKFLNPAFLENPERLLNVCENLIKAMWLEGEAEPRQCTYRVERISSFENMKLEKQTISPTSTSKNGFLLDYENKKGLVLLEFIIEQGVPRADMGKLLPHYSKAKEAEILLAPWLPLEFNQRSLNEKEQTIRDYDGKPPVMAWRVTVKKPSFIEDINPRIMEQSGADAGQRIFKALSQQKTPDKEDIRAYSLWKEAFREQLKVRCYS